jgi:hypothetical protein
VRKKNRGAPPSHAPLAPPPAPADRHRRHERAPGIPLPPPAPLAHPRVAPAARPFLLRPLPLRPHSAACPALPPRIAPRRATARPGTARGDRGIAGRAGAGSGARDGDFTRGEGGAGGPGGQGEGQGPHRRGRGGGRGQEVRRLGDVWGLDELVAVLEARPPPAAADRRGGC